MTILIVLRANLPLGYRIYVGIIWGKDLGDFLPLPRSFSPPAGIKNLPFRHSVNCTGDCSTRHTTSIINWRSAILPGENWCRWSSRLVSHSLTKASHGFFVTVTKNSLKNWLILSQREVIQREESFKEKSFSRNKKLLNKSSSRIKRLIVGVGLCWGGVCM